MLKNHDSNPISLQNSCFSETVKTRIQVSGAPVGETISATFAEGGIRPFYKGLLFAFGREMSYTSIKLGACT
jgi:hypothetical protein